VRKIEGWEVIASPDFRPRCFLTEENTCSVYELRPLACRTYPQWPQIWESEESLREETEKCPGLRRALALVKKQK
jgi:Fe-S-cluster containining protein